MKLFTILVIAAVIVGCKTPAAIKESRERLKEYAFCRCLQYASPDTALIQQEISASVYADISAYSLNVYSVIDSISKEAARKIKPVIHEDYEGKKAIVLNCFIFYKSNQLDSLVKKMDQFKVLK